VIVQSSLKGHPIFQHASKEDYKTFFNEEMEARELFAFPPFTRLTKLIFSGKNERHVKQIAETFHTNLLKKLPSDFTLYPVIPCGYAKIKDNFRFKLLIKGTKPLLLSSILMQLRLEMHLPRSIRLLVDVDPTSIFS